MIPLAAMKWALQRVVRGWLGPSSGVSQGIRQIEKIANGRKELVLIGDGEKRRSGFGRKINDGHRRELIDQFAIDLWSRQGGILLRRHGNIVIMGLVLCAQDQRRIK